MKIILNVGFLKTPYNSRVTLDAKQKHLGCKKVRGQSEASHNGYISDQKL